MWISRRPIAHTDLTVGPPLEVESVAEREVPRGVRLVPVVYDTVHLHVLAVTVRGCDEMVLEEESRRFI